MNSKSTTNMYNLTTHPIVIESFPTPIASPPNLKRSHSEISVINQVEDDDLNTCQLPQGFDFKINQVHTYYHGNKKIIHVD